MEFTAQFKAARRVSTPLVCIRTFDAKNTIDRIRRDALNQKTDGIALIRWDAIHGLVPLNEKGKLELAEVLGGAEPGETANPVEALRRLENLSQTAGGIVFFLNMHLQWSEPAVIQAIWNLRDNFKANGNMLVPFANAGATLPTELQHDVMVLDEPLPTAEELKAIVSDAFKSAKLPEPSADVMTKATDALIGLPAFPADQSSAMCLNTIKVSPDYGKLDIPELWQRKRQIISQTPGLSVYTGKATQKEIGGVANAKNFLASIMSGPEPPKVILRLDEMEKAFAGTGTDTSGTKTELTGSMLSWMQDERINGVIFIGIPGASKSQLIYAFGNDAGVPVINFDLAAMQDSRVGQSGANLRTAQKAVNATSGGRILAIATVNSLGALPPELLRRFNLGIFFFDAPTEDEKPEIWRIHRTRYNIPESDVNPNDAGFTGAEIEQTCYKAYLLRQPLAEAATYVVPVMRARADEMRALRQSCSGKYISASKKGVYTFGDSEPVTHVQNIALESTGRKIRELN